jgi:hypothetical protein
MHEVFGRRWPLAIICAFAPSAMLGDGQRFDMNLKCTSMDENVKDM